ncbi:MAG: acyltransferase [Bacteroidales bacterium]|nr:acyltransferase [Bacteroidales bacterium]
MDVFRYQSTENSIYAEYIRLLGRSPSAIGNPEEIPFLPVEFFRKHRVLTGTGEAKMVFESSRTTSTPASKHYVSDPGLYRESFTRGFELFYGKPDDYRILALLPSYLERKHSSLVFMTDELIRLSGHPKSGFYLNNLDELAEQIAEFEEGGRKTLLLGVSFALADLAEKYPMKLRHAIVMETGGMKGQRREMTREELHDLLKRGLGIQSVHSEYGMTELLSQAYSKGSGVFHCPPWMRVMIRDPYDPLSPMTRKSSGGINIIDLANIHSCSFIATQDIGKLTGEGGFEVLGRFDSSDIRGCNLMVE